MKIIKFEGSPEEFRSVAYLFDEQKVRAIEKGNQNPESVEEKVSAKAAFIAMLRRIEISQGQLDVYRVLANGELEFFEYLRQMQRSVQEIRGVHGTLGRRISKTPEISKAGLVGSMDAIAIWQKREGKTFISLRPEFIEVLKEERIVN
jgi:hypothetical protein